MKLIPVIRDGKTVVICCDNGKTIDNLNVTDISKESYDNKHVIVFKAEIYVNIDHIKNSEKFEMREFEEIKDKLVSL